MSKMLQIGKSQWTDELFLSKNGINFAPNWFSVARERRDFREGNGRPVDKTKAMIFEAELFHLKSPEDRKKIAPTFKQSSRTEILYFTRQNKEILQFYNALQT